MRISTMFLAGLIVVAPGLCGSALAATANTLGSAVVKASATVNGKPLTLQRQEQVALMFMIAVSDIENECEFHATNLCSMDEMVNGPKSNDSWRIKRLAFDPRTSDPNYTYVFTVAGKDWALKAIPKRPGLGGFYFAGGFRSKQLYNPKGEATLSSMELDGYSVGVGADSFER